MMIFIWNSIHLLQSTKFGLRTKISWQSISVQPNWTCRCQDHFELSPQLHFSIFLILPALHSLEIIFAAFSTIFIRASFLKYHYIATFIYFNSEKTHCNDFLFCQIESLINGLVIRAIAVILTNVIKQSRDSILSLEHFCPSKRPL